MLNKVVIMGRFTKDAELRSTGTGTSVTSFTLATDSDFKGQNGERETYFINCVAWRGTAEFICKYFKKGSLAVVEGRLETRPYDDAEGKKRTATEVVVNNIYFAETKREEAPAPTITPENILSADESDFPF